MNPTYYSPTTYNENSSMNSDGSNSTYCRKSMESDEEGSTHDSDREEDQNENNHSNKKKIHRDIEARRRHTESKHIHELSTLIPNWYETKSTKLSQLGLLQMAADLLEKINLRHRYDPLLPSYLTQDEINFLNLEASNSFLFITTIESTIFRIIHVTDSIYRVLHMKSEDWFEKDFFHFIHPDDLLQVQSQLSSIAQFIDNKPSFKCRLKRNDSYSSVIINGMIKKLDQTLKPISTNEYGFFCFIGICNLPLISEYSEKNMAIYKNPNPQSLVFVCRCLPNDWKIFLVDCSVSTFPSISFDFYRNKTILEFIYSADQPSVKQYLLNSTLTTNDELTTCHFIYSSTEILAMILEIKPLLNPITKRTDCLELTFKHILDLFNTNDN